MITPAYCHTMARYNAWQNNGLIDVIKVITLDDLHQDRGAFFGSIMGTLNHLLWGDVLWISRFDGGDGPDASIKDSVEMTSTPAMWANERLRADARIALWASSLDAVDLVGDLEWYSGASEQHLKRPVAMCVTHFFNHQTHHRGQVHAMLTAAGQKPNDTDLVLMPEDV